MKPSEWAKAELDIADEWAEKLFNAWIEIWEIQGFPQSHAFYRAIFGCQLVQLFAGRRSAFHGKCEQFGTVKRDPGYYSAALGWFAREMDKLTSKWNRRVNVESRKKLYTANRTKKAASNNPAVRSIVVSPTPPPRVSLGDSQEAPRSADDKLQFEPLNDYLLIRGCGREYMLTPHAAKVVKALHEAAKKKHGLTAGQVRGINKGGRFWETFRSLDGLDFKRDFIETSTKGYYRLKL